MDCSCARCAELRSFTASRDAHFATHRQHPGRLSRSHPPRLPRFRGRARLQPAIMSNYYPGAGPNQPLGGQPGYPPAAPTMGYPGAAAQTHPMGPGACYPPTNAPPMQGNLAPTNSTYPGAYVAPVPPMGVPPAAPTPYGVAPFPPPQGQFLSPGLNTSALPLSSLPGPAAGAAYPGATAPGVGGYPIGPPGQAGGYPGSAPGGSF